MLPLNLLTALLLSLISHAIPHRDPTTPIPEDNTWACDIRAWVRAPDLAPNIKAPADARLVMNGTDCGDVVKWEVGLRLFERSIFRFSADGVELPTKPKYNYTQSWTPYNNSIFKVAESISHYSSESNDPVYMAQTEEYSQKVNTPSMWVVKGVERRVFDVKKTLHSVQGMEAMPNSSVQSFEVHMPNTNFPPLASGTSSQWGSLHGTQQMVNAETMFEYYFDMTLRNGTILNYPSGYTAFLPVSAPVEETAGVRILTVNLTNPRTVATKRDDWDDEWPMLQPGGIRGQKQPDCDAGNSASFTVQVQVPRGGHIEQGQTLWLNTTITRHGNGTESPRSITLTYMPCTSMTWASGFAHSDPQSRATKACRSNEGYHRGMSQGGMLKVKPFNLTSHQEEVRNGDGRSGVFYSSGTRDGRRREGIELDPFLEEQSIMVNFTVPDNAFPTFNGTFHAFTARIGVKLFTTFGCEDAVTPLANNDAEESDEDWGEHIRTTPKTERRISHRPVHFGNMSSIVVDSKTDAGSPIVAAPIDYRTAGARAPVLVGVSETAGEFPVVSLKQAEEKGDSELKVSRYVIWDRVQQGPFGHYRQLGGPLQYVGNVWKHKEARELLKQMEADAKEAVVDRVGMVLQA